MKGLVGAIVLVEDCGGNVMDVAKVGDLGDRSGSWDGGIGAGVNRSDEGSGQECCVQRGGDSELKYSDCAAAQVRLDGCGIRVQF